MAHAAATYKKEAIWDLLEEVKDPEIPVLSIVDLGIAREVIISGNNIRIRITPTYSGCPAMQAIEDAIEKKMRLNGLQKIEVVKDFSETWTTDWMTDEGKQKLQEYGIAPPQENDSQGNFLQQLQKPRQAVTCPHCGTENTYQQSEFGSTACKSLHYCQDCEEPFEHFKCI